MSYFEDIMSSKYDTDGGTILNPHEKNEGEDFKQETAFWAF